MMSNNKKQSLLVSGLISSAGLFFSKVIGLFYAIPFNTIMETNTNINLYGSAYQIYMYLLNISLAGFPFAVAALVAKYSTLNDHKTVLLIRKLSFMMMALFGFTIMSLTIIFATPISQLLVPKGAEDMRVVLIMLSFALFIVPILSSIRGFYQGLKDMETYALSQVLEQLIRVAFLLITSAVFVYLFNFDRIWAVYFGVLSTSVAALLAILHLKLKDRKVIPKLELEASHQKEKSVDKKIVIKELLLVALPYLVVVVLSSSDNLINTFYLKSGFLAHGYSANETEIIQQSINYGTLKLTSIPLIIAPGFSAAILPMITSYLTKKDYHKVSKSVSECIDSVLYICMFLCFCLFLYAKPIYAILFPVEKGLETCVYVLRWYAFETLFAALSSITTSIVMAAGMRSAKTRNSIIITIFKLLITYPMIYWFGVEGLIMSSIISLSIFIGSDIYLLRKKVKVKLKYTLRKIVFIILSLLPMIAVCYFFNILGISGCDANRTIGLIELAINGGFASLVFFVVSYFFGLPQTIFHFDLNKIMHKIKGKGAC